MERNCSSDSVGVKCHTTSKSEPLKGPFLGDITVRYKKPEIIESILRPNAQIAQGFVTTTLEMKDGSDWRRLHRARVRRRAGNPETWPVRWFWPKRTSSNAAPGRRRLVPERVFSPIN